jgi:hypothetical protein
MKKLFKRTGYIILPIAILLFVLLLNWESAGYYVLKKVAQFHAGRAHIVLNIGRISGNPFSETTLENITIFPVEASPQAYSLKTDIIICTYNLWDLKEGYEFFFEGLSCSVSTPEFSYDFRSAALQDLSPDGPTQFLVPAVLPKLDVHNGTVILTHDGWDAEIRGIDSSLRSTADADHELHLDVNSLRFSQEGVSKIETGFTSLLRHTEAKLSIVSFEVGDKEISATGFIDLAQIHKGFTGFATDLTFAESQLNITGSIENKLLKAHVRTDNFDISELQKRLGGSGWDISGKIRGEADLAYNLKSGEAQDGSFSFDVQEGQLHGLEVDALAVKGHLEKSSLYLEDARAVAFESSLTITRGIIPIPTAVEAFESVPINLSARFESSNLEGLAGLFGDMPLNGQVAADMSIDGSIKEPKGEITLSGEHLRYKELQLGSLALQGELRVSQEKLGKLKSVQFTVTELTQTNNSGSLALVTPATATWKQDTFSLSTELQLDGQSEVAIEIVKKPEKETAAEITTRSLDSDGWLGSFMPNRYFFHDANIEAVFTGLPNNLQLQVGGTISEVGGTDVPFPLTGKFSLQYSPQGIEISEFTWKSHERNQVTLTGRLPYDPLAQEPFLDGDLSLKGHVDFPSLVDVAGLLEPWGIGKGSVALDMDVTGSWNQPEGHVLFQAEGIEPPDTLKQYMDSSVNLTCDIAALGGSIVLQAANLNSSAYSAQASGSWKHGISIKELLQNRKAEIKGELEADATVQLKDLNFLRDRVSWLRRIEGDMQGELHLAGPVTNPSLKGSFTLKNGEISHTFNFPMLSAVNLQGNFDERSLTIKNMQTEVGGSPVNLSGDINKVKESAAVNLHVDGKNVLLFRNNDMRMRGDVQLDVSGLLESLAVKGTTGLTGGYYTGNIDFLGKIGSSSAPVSEGVNFLFSFPGPPLKNAALDIKITTIEPFRIRNNLIRGVLRPELSLKGTGELPFLVGTIYIDPSRVLLPSGRLQVQSGLLRFLAGKPDRPQLDLLAQSKVLGYDINVVTQGPLDNPVITLSSNPALPNDDLLLLLLTGQPPKQDVGGGTKSSVTTNVMVYLGRDFLNKWLDDESGATDETIFDRFELDYGRGITKSGEQTVESTFRLSKKTIRTGKIYYLSGEKDKYDAYNYGLKLVFRFE